MDLVDLMNNKGLSFKGLAALIAALAFASGATAQDYSIDWYSIDGGSGTSSGGEYELSGTTGQADASTVVMTGGDYSLTGGFWSYFSFSSSDAPALTIGVSGLGEVSISWSPNAAGFVLQERADLGSGDWSDAMTSTNPILLPASGETRFFRLVRR